jgi:hypothetical protein
MVTEYDTLHTGLDGKQYILIDRYRQSEYQTDKRWRAKPTS